MNFVEWMAAQTLNSTTLETVLRARVRGKDVVVYVSAEAVQDYGLPACRDVAEGKILAGMRREQPPARVHVRTADFA